MANQNKPPKFYRGLRKSYPRFFKAWEGVGMATRKSGPLNEKTCQLIQLAAAAAMRSEGAVHSHVRRAVEAGATTQEIHQALMVIAPTAGFPIVIAALSWAEDLLSDS